MHRLALIALALFCAAAPLPAHAQDAAARDCAVTAGWRAGPLSSAPGGDPARYLPLLTDMLSPQQVAELRADAQRRGAEPFTLNCGPYTQSGPRRVVNVSPPIYTRAGDHAVFSVLTHAGGLSAEGYTCLMRRNGAAWHGLRCDLHFIS